MLGAVSGAVTGLVAVTPAAGFAGPMGAIVLGIVATAASATSSSRSVKNKFDYDDSLDVFGIHCIGGIIGALGTGILVNPALGGAGIVDYLDRRLRRRSTPARRRRCGRSSRVCWSRCCGRASAARSSTRSSI